MLTALTTEKSYDSRKKLEVDSIVIQSPLLKRVLHRVLKDYPGVTTKLNRLTFTAPFKPFVHRWSEFTQVLDSDEYDEATKTHVKLLYDVLHDELKDVILAVKDYTKNAVVTYEHVWAIFQPGSTLFTSKSGRPVALKLEQGNYGEHHRYGHCYMLEADRIDWDGTKFGHDSVQQIVLPFAGTVPITELICYPMQFHPECESVQKELVERGRLFEQLAGFHYKSYEGMAIDHSAIGSTQISVDNRIVVDAASYGKFNAEHIRTLKPLQRADAMVSAQTIHCDDDGGYYDENMHNNRNQFYSHDDRQDPDFDDGLEKARVPLTEDQLMLCTPVVKGYGLKQKKWLEFFVDCMGEVQFSERAFEQLVLPAGHKQMILAFAQSQVRYKDRFDDDITGKGKGMIMLLSGGPGIGKTLTAESVAEAMKVPLYVMSAGDLGVSSWDVEQNLNRVLEMAAKWNAVLLLDECDVFLEARSTSDLDRNRIVSIFLRTLEYYEGILFLTTNRVKNMDEAFQSRIHLSLEYPPLDRPARKKVWSGFLNRAARAAAEQTVAVDDDAPPAGHDLTDAQIDKLAKLEINGRVIKNVLKTSNLLACHEGKKLNFDHLKTVLKIEGHTVEE
jgi:hypothetical protein